MSGRLPQTVQPLRLAETGAVLHGRLGLGGMARLATYLHDTDGEVNVDLGFDIDEAGTRYVRGHLRAVLHLVCQRCLQSFGHPMDVGVSLGFARSDDSASGLPERYEPLVLEDESVNLAQLIEDELILALPIVPAHAPEDCPVATVAAAPVAEEGPEDGKRRPFEGLADLLKGRD